jgi:hypothetical protein
MSKRDYVQTMKSLALMDIDKEKMGLALARPI